MCEKNFAGLGKSSNFAGAKLKGGLFKLRKYKSLGDIYRLFQNCRGAAAAGVLM